MGKMKINIKESDIRKAVEEVLNEGVLGMNGEDLERLGLRNPAEDYKVNYTELAEKCQQALTSMKEFNAYINGVEEDAENGIEKQDGVSLVATMRGYWTDDCDDQELAESLKELGHYLYRVESYLTDIASHAQFMAQAEARHRSR